MFGAFKPTAPLSGGLLWKIPWRLSPPQKLRHRRRLRRVDNVVTVLDTALKRSTSREAYANNKALKSPNPPVAAPEHQKTAGKASQQTLEGQVTAKQGTSPASIAEQRHGRGPKEGEFVPAPIMQYSSAAPLTMKLLSEQAKEEKTIKLISRWKAEMPTEQEMLPRDKYFMFDKKVRGYRKGVHKLPKWTRVSQRLNPPGF